MRTLALAVFLLLALPAAAAAQIEEAARALRSDPVYVDPAAESADRIAEEALRDEIQERGASPIYIAVLPESAASTPEAALKELHDAVGLSGTYVVVVGRRLRAGSDLFGVAGEASAAAQDARGDLHGALVDLIGRVGNLRAGRDPSASDSGGSSLLPFAIVIALFGVVGFALVRRRSRSQAAELAEVKANLRDDLVALGDDIRALDLDVEMPDADPAAKEDYANAVAAYERANLVFATARSTGALRGAAESLEEGRYAMTCAKERLAGREAPERKPPCFFDLRHGPSSRRVEWAPGGGTLRPVPACEADAQRVDRGEDPHARELSVGGRRVPYWEAGPAYAPYYGGFHDGYGGLVPGLLIGSMVGGGWDAPSHGGGGDFGGGGGGGDFGGGDFGGGGGFGGGDF